MAKRDESLHRIAELLIKLRLGMLTGEERDELTKWREASPANGKLYERWERGEFLEREYRLFREVNYRGVLLQMKSQVARQERKKKVLRLRSWGIVAAVASLLVGIFVYFQGLEDRLVSGKPVIAKINGQFPVLELENGSSVVLDSVPMSFLEAGVAVKKSEQLSLSYALPDTLIAREPVYNVLRVPRGAEYDLILSDGSRVWLNAESRLRYPVVFSDSCREVELEGEGYFEVAKDSHRPFRVMTRGQVVEVLGTRFNVEAYPASDFIYTTLIKGKVAVEAASKREILLPGMQSMLGDGDLHTRLVDTTSMATWRNGMFVLEEHTLEEIMDQMSRWYDFTVFYQNPELKKIVFKGKVSRYDSFEFVLRLLEKTGNIRFDIQGKTVQVRRSN